MAPWARSINASPRFAWSSGVVVVASMLVMFLASFFIASLRYRSAVGSPPSRRSFSITYLLKTRSWAQSASGMSSIIVLLRVRDDGEFAVLLCLGYHAVD